MKENISILLRNIATGLKESADNGTPYENISIFLPSNTPTDVGSVGIAEPITEEDSDEKSKWKSDMRRQGPYPPLPDILDSGTAFAPANTEIPGGAGDEVEGPKTDAQGKRTRNTPDDPEPGIVDPTDLNRDIFSPTDPDDMGSAEAK